MRYILCCAFLLGACDPTLQPEANIAPTWHSDVAPLVAKHCAGCHSPGHAAAYLPLQDPDTARLWAPVIVEQVTQRNMPPFHAAATPECTPRFPFMHDARLTTQEIQTFIDWAEGDTPLGVDHNDTDLTPPVAASLSSWDLELIAKRPYEAEFGDNIVCFVLDPERDKAMWITAMELQPEDRAVVHHVAIRLDDATGDAAQRAGGRGWYECSGDRSGDHIGEYLPGAEPTEFPPGVGVGVRPNQAIVLQVHYHVADDQPHSDLPRIRLQASEKPLSEPRFVRVTYRDGSLDPDEDEAIFIPAGASEHDELFRYDLPEEAGDYQVLSIANHMHYVGKSAIAWVEHADPPKGTPTSECLLNTPHWDINWQPYYRYHVEGQDAPVVSGGDTLWVRCTYDNTFENLNWAEQLDLAGIHELPDVYGGSSSLDEMCGTDMTLVKLKNSQSH